MWIKIDGVEYQIVNDEMVGRNSMDMQDMRQLLMEAKQKIAEQQETIRELTSPPFQYATILGVNNERNTVTIKKGSTLVEIVKPNKFSNLTSGDCVVLNEAMNIINRVPHKYTSGRIATVERVMDTYVEVSVGGEKRMAFTGIELEPGDTVVLDDDVIFKKLDKPKTITNNIQKIGWDDIGGLHNEIEAVKEIIELPFQHQELFARFGKKPSKGVLLYGPPGNGKTMLGKAAAESIAQIHNRESVETGFILVNGPELLNPYVGATEANIREVFRNANSHYNKHGYPAIIFIDEADSILRRRGSGRSSDIEITTVATFLAEADGVHTNNAIIFLATNIPESIDPAVLRDGRIDKKVRIGSPNENAARQILKIHLRNKPLECDVDTIANETAKAVFAHQNNGFRGAISGSLLANIVENATLVAIKRQISSGDEIDAITIDDIKTSIKSKVKEREQLYANVQG